MTLFDLREDIRRQSRELELALEQERPHAEIYELYQQLKHQQKEFEVLQCLKDLRNFRHE
jgi:uncharacterized membrane-anchored protein